MKYKIVLVLAVTLVGVGVLSGCPFGLRAGATRTFHGMKFQWCPAGTFTMGSPADEEGRRDNEAPHRVTLTQGYWLGAYEVTQSEWEDVMGDNPADFPGANRPVEMVSWEDVQDFLAELNAGIGAGKFRLPTEAEWEYACRAGTTTRFHWGEDPDETEIDDFAWYDGNSADETHPVGGKMPNAWGLYDMNSNVFEWCQDWHDSYPEWPLTDPTGPEDGARRVLRGGAFDASPNNCRSAFRNSNDPDSRFGDYGFRILREP